MNRILTLSLVLFAMALPCMAQPVGTITENSVVMEVKSVVALFDASEPMLRIALLPFEPTPEEVSKLQAGNTEWLLDKGSPNSNKWPDRCPYALLELSWKSEKATVGDPKTANFYLFSYGVGPKAASQNVNNFGKNIDMSLTGPLKVGGEINFSSKGSETLLEDKLEWDVKVKSKLLSLKKK